MHRLEQNAHALKPLIAGMEHHLSVHAFADGHMPGWAYVDDRDYPRSALAGNSEGWYLIGDSDNSRFVKCVRDFLNDEAIPGARSRGEKWVPLHYHPIGWAAFGEEILPAIPFAIEYQHYLLLAELRIDWRRSLPAGYALCEVDAGLLAASDRPPVSRMVRWAEDGFGSLEAYLRSGLGRCVERDGEIVAWCMPDCATGFSCEIGIYTIEGQRRRGLATAAAAAVVEGWLAMGYRSIGWHCWSGNEASAGLARKVGFTHALDHYAFCISAS